MTTKYNFYTLPLLVACSFFAVMWFATPTLKGQAGHYSNIFYTAHNLVHYGIFSDTKNTSIAKGQKSKKTAWPGRSRSPGLPFLIAGYASIDPEFQQALACFSALGTKCSEISILNRYFAVQFLFLIAGALAGYYLAFLLSGSQHTALLTMILLLVGSEMAGLGKYIQPRVYQFFLLYMALIFLVLMYQRKNVIFSFLAGLFFGLLILFQSYFIFGVFLAIPLVSIVLMMEGEWKVRQSLGASAGLILGVVLVAGLWGLRNYQLFGDFWIDPFQTARALSRRIEYNEMSALQGIMSILHYLPSYASDLGDQFLSTEFKQKLRLYDPGRAIYLDRSILNKVIAEQKDAGQWFGMLMKAHVFSDLGHHIQISVPLFIRGLWAGGSLITLIGLFFIRDLIRIHLKRERFFPLLLVLVVMVSFSVAFALVTPAMFWFNLPIVFIYCYAISYVVGCF